MKNVDEHGNIYQLAYTDGGLPTFEHIQTGQFLHSHFGPYEEAWQLYVQNSGVLKRQGACTVFDLGLGCGSQVIAMRDAFFQNQALTDFKIVSFDLETLGLACLMDKIELFPFAQPHFEFLRQAVSSGKVVECFGTNRNLEWQFIEGDFAKTVFQSNLSKADIVCYDFFSASAHPHLWTYGIIKRLYELCSDEAIVLTYSSATSVRAAMLAAGFYVGFSPSGSQNFRMTVASKQQNKIEVPLDERWLKKFERSTLPYLEMEDENAKKHILRSVLVHPQFK